MLKNPHKNFVKNSRSIVGSLLIAGGLCLTLPGIYEFHTAKKLPEKDNGFTSLPVIHMMIENLNDMTIIEKTGIGGPMLLFGSMILFPSKKHQL